VAVGLAVVAVSVVAAAEALAVEVAGGGVADVVVSGGVVSTGGAMSMPTKSILPSNVSSSGSAVLTPTMTLVGLEIEPAEPALVLPRPPSTFATTEVLVFMHSSVCHSPSTMSCRDTLFTVPPLPWNEQLSFPTVGSAALFISIL
jgi:hypothetical protein